MTHRQARWLIAILGVLTPYLARIPGAFTHGVGWLTSYFGDNLFAPLIFGAFNAVCWAPIVLATLGMKRIRYMAWPAVLGLGSSAILHSMVDLAADAQAAIALVVIPFYTLPFTGAGWLIGFLLDRRSGRDA